MFLKLLQLQIAPNPQDIISWMFEHGVNKTIESYGFSKDEVQSISTQGTIAISKWTTKLNNIVSANKGHKDYFSNLKLQILCSYQLLLKLEFHNQLKRILFDFFSK